MGKRKIAIEKVEDKRKREVHFSKRRGGLFKKAQKYCELNRNAQIGILVFSPAGKPFTFGFPSSDEVFDRFLSECDLQSYGEEIRETGIGDNGDQTYLEDSKGFGDLVPETNSEVHEILNALFPEAEVEFRGEQIQETGTGDHEDRSYVVDLGLQNNSVVADDETLDWADLVGFDEISMGRSDIIDGFSVDKNGGGCFDQDSEFMGFPGLRFKEFPDPMFQGFDEIQFQSQEKDHVFGKKSIQNYMDLAEEFIHENSLDFVGFAEMDCSGVLQ